MKRYRSKDESGQAMVEFALILPILLLVVCGIIDFGWIFSKKIQLESASSTGARYAIVSNNDVVTQQTIVNKIRDTIPGATPETVTVELSYSNGTLGDVKVTLTEKVKALTPITDIFAGNEITLRAETTMKMSY